MDVDKYDIDKLRYRLTNQKDDTAKCFVMDIMATYSTGMAKTSDLPTLLRLH